MRPGSRLLIYGSIAVLVFDATAAFFCKLTNLPYATAIVGSLIIYSTTGALVARKVKSRGLGKAAATGAVLGLVDSSAGWWISSLIGPGKPGHPLSVIAWLFTAMAVSITATLVALLGGAAEGVIARTFSQQSQR